MTDGNVRCAECAAVFPSAASACPVCGSVKRMPFESPKTSDKTRPSWFRQLFSGEAAAAARRQQVEQDGLFCCRGCGTKGVKRPSDGGPPVCSKSCLERFNAASLCQAMSGGVVVMVDAGPGEHSAANALRSRKWKTYCAWCGATITNSNVDACPTCHGNPSGGDELPASGTTVPQQPPQPPKPVHEVLR